MYRGFGIRSLNFCLFLLYLFGSTSTYAGMVWVGVGVNPSEISRLKTDEKFLNTVFVSAPKGQSINLDKAWHGIHFLLTGNAEAANSLSSKVIFGGESFGPDLGYGPAQLLTPAEVKGIAKLLMKETPERLAARYDPVAFEQADIYPSVIWVREGKAALTYVLGYYRKLVEFYQNAAERGNAVVFVIQ